MGAFLTRPLPAQVSLSGAFFPPRKEVTFNQLLTTNDGILAHHYAQKESVSYEHALRLIEKEVSNWKKTHENTNPPFYWSRRNTIKP